MKVSSKNVGILNVLIKPSSIFVQRNANSNLKRSKLRKTRVVLCTATVEVVTIFLGYDFRKIKALESNIKNWRRSQVILIIDYLLM